jgi:hypothetical protein
MENSMPNKYESNPEPQLRQLTSDEIDVVSAGIISGEKVVQTGVGTFIVDSNGDVKHWVLPSGRVFA